MALNGLNPLAYIGINSPNPSAQIFSRDTDPTVNDSFNVSIGDIWINLNTQPPGQPLAPQNIFMLTSLASGVATWTEIGQTNNVLNVVGGTNITVNTVAGTATVNLNPSVVLTGSLSAGTTVTAGTGITSTAGNINAASGSLLSKNVAVSAAGPSVTFSKSRAGGVITSGDNLGQVIFNGFDGAAFQLSAAISVDSTGTIGAGRVPSTIKFFTTPDAVSATQQRVEIDESGTLLVNAPTGGGSSIVAQSSITTVPTANVNGGTLRTNGDTGAPAVGITAITNGNTVSAAGGGKLTIDSQTANPGVNAGFMKIYIGGVAAYIPYFTNIAP